MQLPRSLPPFCTAVREILCVQMPKKSFRLSADGVAWLPLLPAEVCVCVCVCPRACQRYRNRRAVLIGPSGRRQASLVARVTEWEEASRKNGISFLPLSGVPSCPRLGSPSQSHFYAAAGSLRQLARCLSGSRVA